MKLLEKSLPRFKKRKKNVFKKTSFYAPKNIKCEDICGYIIESIRSALGENAVISVSLDLHANVTNQMMKAADFFAVFKLIRILITTKQGTCRKTRYRHPIFTQQNQRHIKRKLCRDGVLCLRLG